MEYRLESELVCPFCGFKDTHIMPTDRCVIQSDCKSCGKKILPKQGDCCIYCSYGSEVCPSMQ